MKKILFSLLLSASYVGYSQTCAVDVTGLDAYISPDTWGMMPDTTDNLPPAQIGVQYDTFLSFKLPLYANELDPTLPAIQLATLQLINVTGLPAGISFTSSASTTDSIFCNTADCKWNGGAYGCLRIIGTPTVSGTFPLIITLEGKTIGGPLAQTGTGDINGYRIVINTTSLDEQSKTQLKVEQNFPNPFSKITNINYSVKTNALVNFTVMNLLGKTVYSKEYAAREGQNTIEYNAEELSKGIYFYSLEINGKKTTKRMVVTK